MWRKSFACQVALLLADLLGFGFGEARGTGKAAVLGTD